MGRAPVESDAYEELSPDDMQRLYPELWEKVNLNKGIAAANRSNPRVVERKTPNFGVESARRGC